MLDYRCLRFTQILIMFNLKHRLVLEFGGLILALTASFCASAALAQGDSPQSGSNAGGASGFELAEPTTLSLVSERDLRNTSSRELFASATEAVRSGRLEEAIVSFRELLRRDPDNTAVHNNLACCLKKQGDAEAALSEFEKAVAASPGKASLQINLARALVDLGQYDRAIETIYLALRLEPSSAAELLLGRSLALKRDYSSAIEPFQQALKADPEMLDAHVELGDALRAVKSFEQALLEYRIAAEGAEKKLSNANQGEVSGKLKKAIESAKADSDEVDSANKGKKVSSDKAIENDEDLDKFRLQLRMAKCFEGLGQFEKARLTLLPLLEKRPDDADCLNCMGVVLWKLGYAPEAAFVLERALKQDSSFLQARNNLGIVLYDLKRYQDSVDVWRQALGLRPDYPQAHYNMGVALFQSGLFSQAADAFRNCLKYAPQDPFAHNNLGLTLLKLGDRSAAADEWKRALQCDANLTEARANLAKLDDEAAESGSNDKIE